MKHKSGFLEIPSDDMLIIALILTDSEELFLLPRKYNEKISAWTQKHLIPNEDHYGSVF